MVRIGFFTCLFLIALRLAIGWHFFFEGLHKYESTQHASEQNKAFSSAGYFSGAEGPLASTFREELGYPDGDTLARLKLADAGDDLPAAKMPAALAREWEAYLKKFSEDYKLDDASRKLAETSLIRAKTDYVLWLTKPSRKFDDPFREDAKAKKITITIQGDGGKTSATYDIPDHPHQRVLDYQGKLLAIRDAIERVSRSFGKDVEKSHLTTLRGEAAALRISLQKDIDEQTQKYKKSLAKLVTPRLEGFSYGDPESMLVDDRVLELVTLREGSSELTATSDQLILRMPAVLDQQWNDYLAYFKEVGKVPLKKDAQRSDQILAEEKLRFVRYLLDFDEYVSNRAGDTNNAMRLQKYREAVTTLRKAQADYSDDPSVANLFTLARAMEGPKRYRESFVSEVSRRTEILKQNLGGFKDSAYTGVTEVEKTPTRFLWLDWPTTRQDWMDWATRWGLLIVGGCLLIGLFTRLACLGCVFFLVTEYLLNSPFPWLPVSPKAEGNYLFINKNVIELIALLVLATLPTGRWFGLDAILSRIWPFRSRTARVAK
jgi:uncharacterized membrane protein YphA (DoxX/SURF4 family)